jgi:hypothetical protein
VFASWWPLAASWLLMALELPVVSAVVARLDHPSVHLAAYGGIVFPLSMLIEAPIIMLLSASTALSRNREAYRRLERFMFAAGLGLGAVHVLVAATPLFDLVVGTFMHPPEAVRGPARIGLLIMIPWTPAIAYRRFQQGVLIRFERARWVGYGTAVRLGTEVALLGLGYALRFPGVVAASIAVASGVTAEAVFSGLAVRPVLRERMREAREGEEPMRLPEFLRFYVPLALTPLLSMASLPFLAAGMGRMPRPLESLAAWPVLSGLTFLLRSLGFAFNEVVVALSDRPGARRSLGRFTAILAAATSLLLLATAVTPLGTLWFARFSALSPPLVALSKAALWLVLPLPAFGVLQSWYQGYLVAGRRTRAIPEATGIGLAVLSVALAAGIGFGGLPGLYVGAGAMTAGGAAQILWLRRRSPGPALAVI